MAEIKDPKVLEAVKSEVGEGVLIARELTASFADVRKFQAEQDLRLKALEHRGGSAMPVMGGARTAGPDGKPLFKSSLHDILKFASREKRGGQVNFSQDAPVSQEWADTFRANPEGWQKDVIAKANEYALKVSGRAANQSAGIMTQGGAWVPDQWMQDIIPALTAKEVVMSAGAGEFNVPAGVGTVKFPREDGRATAYWIGEGSAPTSSGYTAGTVEAQQHKCAVLIKSTNDFLEMGIPATEAYLRRALVRDLGLALDLAALRGTGGSNEPVGISTLTGVGSVVIGTNGGAITYNLLRHLVRTVLKANAPMSRPGFIMHPSLWTEVMKLKDDNNRPLFHSPDFIPGLAGATPTTLFGYPVFTSTQIPITITKNASGATLTECYFGDWSELERVLWQSVEIRLSNQAYDGTDSAFTQDMTFFLAIVKMDWVARHAASFALIPDATGETA